MSVDASVPVKRLRQFRLLTDTSDKKAPEPDISRLMIKYFNINKRRIRQKSEQVEEKVSNFKHLRLFQSKVPPNESFKENRPHASNRINKTEAFMTDMVANSFASKIEENLKSMLHGSASGNKMKFNNRSVQLKSMIVHPSCLFYKPNKNMVGSFNIKKVKTMVDRKCDGHSFCDFLKSTPEPRHSKFTNNVTSDSESMVGYFHFENCEKEPDRCKNSILLMNKREYATHWTIVIDELLANDLNSYGCEKLGYYKTRKWIDDAKENGNDFLENFVHRIKMDVTHLNLESVFLTSEFKYKNYRLKF